MKGQFMIISSIIVGLIIISLASTISSTQSQEFDNLETGYVIETLKTEASEIDMSSPEERRAFEQLTFMTDYNTHTEYWSENQCFNVTLRRTDETIELECIS